MSPIKDPRFLTFGIVNAFIYLNYKGERELRHMIPMSLRFGTSEYYQVPQWLVECYDVIKKDYRTLSLIAIELTEKTLVQGNLDASHSTTDTEQPTGSRKPIQPDTVCHENDT